MIPCTIVVDHLVSHNKIKDMHPELQRVGVVPCLFYHIPTISLFISSELTKSKLNDKGLVGIQSAGYSLVISEIGFQADRGQHCTAQAPHRGR